MLIIKKRLTFRHIHRNFHHLVVHEESAVKFCYPSSGTIGIADKIRSAMLQLIHHTNCLHRRTHRRFANKENLEKITYSSYNMQTKKERSSHMKW